MVDQLWQTLHTWSSNGVESRIVTATSGVMVTCVAWLVLKRLITRIVTTAVVLGVSALMFCHPVDFAQSAPTPPFCCFGYQP